MVKAKRTARARRHGYSCKKHPPCIIVYSGSGDEHCHKPERHDGSKECKRAGEYREPNEKFEYHDKHLKEHRPSFRGKHPAFKYPVDKEKIHPEYHRRVFARPLKKETYKAKVDIEQLFYDRGAASGCRLSCGRYRAGGGGGRGGAVAVCYDAEENPQASAK